MKYLHLETPENLRVPTIGVFDKEEEARHLFKFMKDATAQESLWSRSVSFPKGEFENYRLIPISKIHLDDDESINHLMTWRNKNYTLFTPQKKVSIESTKVWLSSLVNENENRILFFVVNKHGNAVGHLGIWLRDHLEFEIDNVIKDPRCSIKGIMSIAVTVLCNWANEFLGLETISLRVLATNSHAISFYSKLTFEEVKREGLREVVGASGVEFVESNILDADNAWITMRADLGAFQDTDEYVLTAGPSIGPFEVSLVSEAVRNGWNHHHSDYLNQFTSEFANYVGAEFAIPTDSCTSALHLSMWALGIGPGDEVIVPEITWVATANAVRYVGATPIFADIDPVTWCMDPQSVERLITKKTKAVIPVHLYGYVSDLNALKKVCDDYGVKLVQDAAPGIGSTYFGEGVAKIGEFSCFSFQGAKLLVSGEGGVLTTNDPDLYARAFKIGDSGRRPGTFWIEMLGKKMKMSNVTSSLALAQLQSAERQIDKKRRIRDWYAEDLAEVEGLTLQLELPNSRSICWMTSIHIDRDGFDREAFREELLKLGVETRPVFSPISRYPFWEKPVTAQMNAAFIGDNAVNLPSGVALSRSTVEKVSSAVVKVLN
jgi:perosamine synthetase